MTGVEFLEEVRQTICRWRVTGMDVYTMTDSLRAPIYDGRTIGWLAVSEAAGQPDDFMYQALYLGDEDDEQHAITITAEEAAQLLDEVICNYEAEVSERGSHRGEEPIPIQ